MKIITFVKFPIEILSQELPYRGLPGTRDTHKNHDQERMMWLA
jgi:hypothetical protein